MLFNCESFLTKITGADSNPHISRIFYQANIYKAVDFIPESEGKKILCLTSRLPNAEN